MLQSSCKLSEVLQVEDTNYLSFIEKDTSVLVFLSPQCPICQKYIYRLNKIKTDYNDSGIDVLGIVPTDSFSDKDIESFKNQYHIEFSILHDIENILVNELDASTTPECIFIVNGEIMYRGAIDNWFYAPGKSANKTTEKYLERALEEFCSGKEISLEKTIPIGCFIEN